MKLLYIEDNLVQLKAMQKIAEQAGFAFFSAITGADGLNLLSELPDLIIVDLQLPDMNGFELAEKILAGYGQAPIIAVSASGLPTDRQRALEAGCSAFIQKPFRFLEMVERLKTFQR